MEYQPLLSTYLKNIETINPQTREHTHRTHLENLLKSIKESLSPKNEALQSLRITHEPNNDKEGRGAPDFLIHNQGLIVGYIENKRVNADLDSIAKSPQVEKYLRLSDNLMLTDYLRFALVRNEKGKAQIVQEYRICELSQMSSTLKNKALLQSKEKELIEAFNLFFTHSPKPIITALEFANALAQRTQILKDSLIQAQHNPHILSLYETFKTQLYKELDFIEFSDSFAQSLTYSLFLARLNNTSNKDIDLYNVKSFIPKSFPLIRAMSGFLDNLEDLDSIKWLIEEILYIINNINIVSIIQELNDIRENSLLKQATHFLHKDPYLHFYETFLSQYDPRLREVRGVYYTPASVVSFIINAIDSTLKKDFCLQKGLSAACENDNITLLDFATGTGTFLLEAFRKALESIPKNSPRYEPKKLLSRFFGFEFLIAPYVIAHLKLSQSFKEEFAAPLQDNQSLSILLTNTLYTSSAKDEINKQSNLFAGMIELAEEFKNAQQIKENPILIITGNPPYSGASANKGLYEDNVRITYGLEPKLSSLNKQERQIIAQYLKLPALERLNRKDLAKHFKDILNTKKLQNEKLTKMLLDDYVKFINFAESKIKNQNSGIFAFISNNSFLDNPTFRGMRYHLLNTFDTMYILDLHGNARKREVAPDGSKDDNVFDIMQGVSINIFIKNTNASQSNDKTNDRANDKTELNQIEKNNTEHLINDKTQQGTKTNQNENENENTTQLAKIYHYDLYGKRIDKANFLYENSLDSINWTTLSPKEPFYLFIPQNDEFRDEYNKGWSVKKIFKVSRLGIKTARDKLCISDSFSLESLNKFKDRVKRFLELDVESARKEFDLGEDSRDWKIEYAQKDLKDTGNNPNNYIKIHYRPFDYRYTYYTGKSKGFLEIPGYETMQHFLGDFENRAISIPRQLKDRNKEWNHCMPTKNITDQALSSGGNGPNTIMPLYLKDTSNNKNTKKNKKDLSFTTKDSNKESKGEWVENFTIEFRSFIDSKYIWSKEEIQANPAFFRDNSTLSPEAILGYIYAVLFHKTYREKYIDFLKIDFPKIPFIESKELFLQYSALGQELINVHLMQDNNQSINQRANKNDLQYWDKCSKTIQDERLLAMCDSNQYSSRFMSNGWGQHGSGNNLPPLSSPKGLNMNIGLVCDRGCKLQKVNNMFITQNIIDLHLVGSGSYAFPLYIKN